MHHVYSQHGEALRHPLPPPPLPAASVDRNRTLDKKVDGNVGKRVKGRARSQASASLPCDLKPRYTVQYMLFLPLHQEAYSIKSKFWVFVALALRGRWGRWVYASLQLLHMCVSCYFILQIHKARYLIQNRGIRSLQVRVLLSKLCIWETWFLFRKSDKNEKRLLWWPCAGNKRWEVQFIIFLSSLIPLSIFFEYRMSPNVPMTKSRPWGDVPLT
jgi:hypothetical protein